MYVCCTQEPSDTAARSPKQLQPTAAASFKDPFQQVANEPWQQLDLGGNDTADDDVLPLPEIGAEVTLSIDNEDDTVVTSSDPAACDFLLAALMFQEQQSLQQEQQQSSDEDVVQEQPSVVAVLRSSKHRSSSCGSSGGAVVQAVSIQPCNLNCTTSGSPCLREPISHILQGAAVPVDVPSRIGGTVSKPAVSVVLARS